MECDRDNYCRAQDHNEDIRKYQGRKVGNEQAIQALQQGKGLITEICDNAIKAAVSLEQDYDGHAPPWNDDYCPFDFCVDMDELKEKVLLHSDRFIALSRWINAHDFNPLDEISAIRHEESGLPEHEQSSPLYLLAIESRNPWVIVDDASPEIDHHLHSRAITFLEKLILQHNPEPPGSTQDSDSVVASIPEHISSLTALVDYPFSCLIAALRPISSRIDSRKEERL
ncbi:MAG: hypothetical protein CL537_04970 [Alcanivoracaceae bacterium]|nr:hypothetical protein [Alcanivoracaceae bacterium]|tara:strand:+ start:11955 stop:12635 length:681 start_codon:yes stop_codon:yes gene_type:complete